jgi:hypothetical protein
MSSHSNGNGMIGMLFFVVFSCFLCGYMRRLRRQRLAFKQQMQCPAVATVTVPYSCPANSYAAYPNQMWIPQQQVIQPPPPPPAYSAPIGSEQQCPGRPNEQPPTYEQALAQADVQPPKETTSNSTMDANQAEVKPTHGDNTI